MVLFKGTRATGGRSGRRMDSYHMRRRYLHSGIAAAAGNDGLGMDEDPWEDDPFGEDPFIDHDFTDTIEG